MLVLLVLGLGFLPPPGALALIGMGMFLAATTHAPLMAILMIFEMTLNYQLILPLMLGCVVSYFIAQGIESRSLYSDALERKGALPFARPLTWLRVSDLMKADPVRVTHNAPFDEIARHFIVNTFRYLYVVDDGGRYMGAIRLDDIKEYLSTAMPGHLVIARDLLSPGPPVVPQSASLEDALEKFTRQGQTMERLPVLSDDAEPKLAGSITKTDLLLALSGAYRR
jgi:CIC family chloride channel protein